jgi:hypothetical protein
MIENRSESQLQKSDSDKTYGASWRGAALQQRIRAGLKHLLISALIAVLISVPIVVWLYPQPFFTASGGFLLMALVIGVDVVVGPLLTLLTYDRSKKSLRMDLTVIAVLQLAALFYGLYATAMSRPVFMTWVVDRYETVTAAQVDETELKKAPLEFRDTRWGHPIQAFAEMPKEPSLRNAFILSILQAPFISDIGSDCAGQINR